MNKKILQAVTAVILFLIPNKDFAQAPTLGAAANFVLFSTVGAVTNSGIPQLTHLTGNVGTNSGSSTGFGNVDGVMHDGDVASGAAAADLLLAYNQLNIAVASFFPAPLLGNGDTLLPGVYHISSAATLNNHLILNGQGNPAAVFIFQVQGALSANAASKIVLINGVMACNVFWKVEGLVSVATGATMRGTIIAHNAAIAMSAADTLEGRALAIVGAVTTTGLLAYIPTGCGSAVLTGPSAPAMTASAVYGLFSSIGPVTNSGITYITGDVGTNSGLTTGFNPLFVTGTIHPIPDASTAAAAADLTGVYTYLNTLPADIELLYPAIFGNDLVLTPHTYLLNAATMLTGNVILNAENNANAIFVMRINGAFTTSTLSNVKLINGALAKNVYWLVNGAMTVLDNSIFKGTMVSAGAINFSPGDSLAGKALSTNGAVNISGGYITTPTPACVAPAISGIQQICTGATATFTDSSAGGTWSSSNIAAAIIGSSSGIATGILPGTTTITYTSPATCTSTVILTVNPLPLPITGLNSVCTGDSITLTDLTMGGTWSSSNPLQAAADSTSGVITGIATGTPTITYSVPGSCSATKSIIVGTYAGVIEGPSNVCRGSTILFTDSTAGGSWSSSNTNATVFGGLVTGVSKGLDTIAYSVTNACGTTTTTKIISIDTTATVSPIAGGSVVCAGSVIILTDTTAGGVWSSSNANAIVVNGVVNGISQGTSTISYTVANACGTATATKIVTVNSMPDEGSIVGPSSVCTGSFITLTDAVTGGTWSSSNTTASVVGGVVTGLAGGIDTIRYAVSNSCGTATATKTIVVNSTPDAGTINGPSSVCSGSLITLTDTVIGGIWSASNSNATVTGGVVNGITPGADTIIYTVTNGFCTANATKIVTVNPLPNAGVITGPSSVCVGSAITLADAVTGGTWSSSNTTASVAGGVVTGLATGIDTIRYAVTNSCGTATAPKTIVVNSLPDAGNINGPSNVCAGALIMLTDTTTGGVWSSSNSNAAVTGGIVTGITAGTDVISYTVANTCGAPAVATKTITVNTLPSAGTITGPASVCTGSTITLADTATGGTWSSSNTTASIAGGVVIGIIAGVDTIMYQVSNAGCSATAGKVIAINATPDAGVISGLSSVCAGSSITLTESSTGGTWSNNNTHTTVVSGLVAGISPGADTIIYTVTNGFCTATATKTVTVNPFLTAGIITGPSGVCIGSATTLTDAATGGIWSASNTAATVVMGVVTGVATGIDTIKYTVTNSCGTAVATRAITISTAPAVPVITTQAPATACTGTMYQNYGIATPAAAGTVYTWTATNATVWAQGAGHQYALVNFDHAGTATVTLNAGLPGSSCTSSASVTISVSASVAQTPVVTYFTSHFVCTPSNEDFYQWGYDNVSTLDSTLLTGEINQDYLNTSPDFYNKDYWVMTSQDGCRQKTYYHAPTAVQTVNNDMAGISLYPNPANTTINVTISGTVTGSIEVQVWNIMGQMMSTMAATDNKAVIDVSALPSGSYVITCLNDGSEIAAARFVKD